MTNLMTAIGKNFYFTFLFCKNRLSSFLLLIKNVIIRKSTYNVYKVI